MAFLLKTLPTLFSSPLFRDVIGGIAGQTFSGFKQGLTQSLRKIIEEIEPPTQKSLKRPSKIDLDEVWEDDEPIQTNRKKVRR